MASQCTVFNPALIVVDLQEDFCPPNGALAVAGGREIAPIINSLLTLPFTTRIATKDYHPRAHISFASNHPPPDNKPFESIITIANPYNPSETQTSRLWPDHCVQGTPGAELIQELDAKNIQHVVEKGKDERVEMYSAFTDPFENPSVSTSELAKILREAQTTHVFVTGLATDYCVKHTAIDAAKEGFKTYVVKDAVRGVDPSPEGCGAAEKDMEAAGIVMVRLDGEELGMVKARA
ncbi:NAD(+) salvage pathway protein [Elasticomyces elasticus]|nr:NAD(+) salvage pathway protein [Elasticomyces elasticus]